MIAREYQMRRSNHGRHVKFNTGLSKMTVMLAMLLMMAAAGAALVYFKSRGVEILEGLASSEGVARMFPEQNAGIKKLLSEGGSSGKLDALRSNTGAAPERPDLPTGIEDASANSKPSKKGIDEIIFRNGDTLTGRIITDKIVTKTEHGSITFKISDVTSIFCIYEADPPYDKVVSKNGDRVTGKLQTETIALRTAGGDTVSISLSKVKIINSFK